MSIPKLRPFLLPLAQTRAIHQLSTLREYMQGADILPLKVNNFTDFLHKRVLTKDQEFAPYMVGLICSSAFMLQVVISTLDTIPRSLLPERYHRHSVLGLDVSKFKILFQAVSKGDMIVKPRIEHLFNKLLDTLHTHTKIPAPEQLSRTVFRNATLSFPGKRHRSFLTVGKADSPVNVLCIDGQVGCECFSSEDSYLYQCPNCLQKQHHLWIVAMAELRKLIDVEQRASSVIRESLVAYKVHTAVLKTLLTLYNIIAECNLFRLCRVVLSTIESPRLFLRRGGPSFQQEITTGTYGCQAPYYTDIDATV